MENNRRNGIIAKEGYEAVTGLRALERAGHCKNLHGIVHEILVTDKFNVNPTNILNGEQALLPKATTAPLHDVLIMKDGNFARGLQLKDTPSPSGISKTLHQINSGKYNGTTMIGTEETAQQLAGKTVQKVHSSGISSETTHRIADKALGNMPSMSALSSAARNGGLWGAGISAGIEAVSSFADVLDGKKNFEDAVADVGTAAVKGGITGAAAAATGSLASGVTTAIFGGTMAPAVLAFGASCIVADLVNDFLS